ncbi:unnamed protein product [Prunus brigantina]
MSGSLPNPWKHASRPGPGQRPSVDQQTKRSKLVPDAGLSLDPSDAFIPCLSSGRSHHDVLRRVGLATSAPFIAIEDIDLDNEPIIPADDEACDAVLGSILHPRDIKELMDLDDRDIALQQAHN